MDFFVFFFVQRKRRESASSSSSIKKVKKPWHEWLCKLDWTFLEEGREVSGALLSDCLFWLGSEAEFVVVGHPLSALLMTTLFVNAFSSMTTLPVRHPSIPAASLLSSFSRPNLYHDTDHPWQPIPLYHLLCPTRQTKPRWTVNWQRELIGTWQDRTK